jgi:transcriptional regulator with XRE-family HTH domain
MAGLDEALTRGIRAARAGLGITQEELGERLGWSRQMIAKLEHGDREIRWREMTALCEALETTLPRLLQYADPDDLKTIGLG